MAATWKILRNCDGGASVRLIRRFLVSRKEMIFDVMEQHADALRISRHLVFDKQSATATTSTDSDTARAPKLAANQDVHFQRGASHK